MKSWYSIKAAAAGGSVDEISVFDYIGYWGVTAADFIRDLKALTGKSINLTINSPGGDVFEAIAMFSALRASGKEITTTVYGIAASAASYLMLAGDKRVMPDNTMQMVHNASTGAWGNAEELVAAAEVLSKVDANLQATYAARTGLNAEEVAALLSKDTYLTAAECLELGLIDEVTPAVKVSAAYELDRLPTKVQALFKAAQPAPVVEPPAPLAGQVHALAKARGFEAYAPVFATDPSVLTLADAERVINVAAEIKALAEVTGMQDQAEPLIRGRKTLAEAQATINAARVKADEDTYVNSAPRTPKPQSASNDADWTPQSVWADIRTMKAGSKK